MTYEKTPNVVRASCSPAYIFTSSTITNPLPHRPRPSCLCPASKSTRFTTLKHKFPFALPSRAPPHVNRASHTLPPRPRHTEQCRPRRRRYRSRHKINTHYGTGQANVENVPETRLVAGRTSDETHAGLGDEPPTRIGTTPVPRVAE